MSQGQLFTKTAKCRGCGAEIWWDVTKNNKPMPRDVGTNAPHWATCRNADDFRKPKAAP